MNLLRRGQPEESFGTRGVEFRPDQATWHQNPPPGGWLLEPAWSKDGVRQQRTKRRSMSRAGARRPDALGAAVPVEPWVAIAAVGLAALATICKVAPQLVEKRGQRKLYLQVLKGYGPAALTYVVPVIEAQRRSDAHQSDSPGIAGLDPAGLPSMRQSVDRDLNGSTDSADIDGRVSVGSVTRSGHNQPADDHATWRADASCCGQAVRGAVDDRAGIGPVGASPSLQRDPRPADQEFSPP